MKTIILAGGGGTRLWPLSRSKAPKQYQAIIGEKTLIQQTYDRLREEFEIDDVYISLRDDNIPFVKQQLPDINEDHYIIEPEQRDTAAAMGFVVAKLFRTCPDEPIAFIPADHIIQNHDVFLRSLRVAEEIINKEGKLVDIGVVPSYPNTNLGYTHIGNKETSYEGVKLYDFLGHTEKPDYYTAEKYIQSGEYLWHANYYMWTPSKFLEAYAGLAPEMHQHLKAIADAVGTSDENKVIKKEYSQIEKVAFDYAITEKISKNKVIIIKAEFYWSDVGMWHTVKQLQEENSEDNVTKGEHVNIDSKNCLIYSTTKNKLIGTLGLEDMIIVDTDDALLVVKKSRDSEVKKIVEQIKEKGREDLL